MFRERDFELVTGGGYSDENDDFILGDDDHRKTITPFHGEIDDVGEHGYRRVPIHVDEHDSSHDYDDRFRRTDDLTHIFRR